MDNLRVGYLKQQLYAFGSEWRTLFQLLPGVVPLHIPAPKYLPLTHKHHLSATA